MDEMKIFENTEFGKVRMVEIEGKPYAVGIDIAKALEYANPSKAIINHCKGVSKLGIPSAGGVQETNVIPEGDIYRLITKAADQSKNLAIREKAERFEHWLFDEVIPSIRKHGAYMTPKKLAESLLNPDTMIQLLTTLKEEQEKNKELSVILEEQKPKVIFANSVESSKTTILVGELAKILKQNGISIGQNRLFAWLRDNGYLISRKGSDYNMPTQYSMERGLFEIKESATNHEDGHTTINKVTKVSGRGQIYFANKFLGDVAV